MREGYVASPGSSEAADQGSRTAPVRTTHPAGGGRDRAAAPILVNVMDRQAGPRARPPGSTATGVSGGSPDGGSPPREVVPQTVLGAREQRRPGLGLGAQHAVDRPADRVADGNDGEGEPGGRPDRAGDADQHPVDAPVGGSLPQLGGPGGIREERGVQGAERA